MDVQLLVVRDCPNAEAAADQVRRALADVGLAPVVLRIRVVTSRPDAERLGFIGSPTVLINGEDPFAESGRPPGITCRVYVTNGVRTGLPDIRQLRQALKRRAAAAG